MSFHTTAGYGDPVTWGGHTPPEEDSTETWYERAARVIDEARSQLDQAATAAFKRNEPAYRLAMLNALSAIEELWLPIESEEDCP